MPIILYVSLELLITQVLYFIHILWPFSPLYLSIDKMSLASSCFKVS